MLTPVPANECHASCSWQPVIAVWSGASTCQPVGWHQGTTQNLRVPPLSPGNWHPYTVISLLWIQTIQRNFVEWSHYKLVWFNGLSAELGLRNQFMPPWTSLCNLGWVILSKTNLFLSWGKNGGGVRLENYAWDVQINYQLYQVDWLSEKYIIEAFRSPLGLTFKFSAYLLIKVLLSIPTQFQVFDFATLFILVTHRKRFSMTWL